MAKRGNIARIGKAMAAGDEVEAMRALKEEDDPARALDRVKAYIAFWVGEERAEKAVEALRAAVVRRAGNH